MDRRIVFLGIAALAVATRLCHLKILWVEEGYPAAAAIQILYGSVPYRDFWFDKPPMFPLTYLLWGAHTGWPLRAAGALFVILASWIAYRCAKEKWGEKEGLLAGSLTAFFLTFSIASTVMALTPDLLMVVPHLLALHFAWRGRPLWSGAAAGVALLFNSKGVFVAAACLPWTWRAWPQFLSGFALPNAAALAALGATGAGGAYWQQVWEWGRRYAGDTLLSSPVTEGIRRTLGWSGFHVSLIVGAAWYWWKERTPDSRRMALWALISLAAVVVGLRFFPRYYFHLLPLAVLAGARGLMLMTPRLRRAVLLLLVVPLLRFGPRFVTLGEDLLAGRSHQWSDLLMDQDSRAAAAIVKREAGPNDTLLVWGYRPDVFAYARLRAGAPFLDSQPLTGVIADRHLRSSLPSDPVLGAVNRRILAGTSPTYIVDGLGPYNPDLAVTAYRDLQDWLAHYDVLAKTDHTIIYRRKP